MSDQRMVGHAIRRRMGAAMSHLGQAEGHAKRNGTWQPPPWGNLDQAEGIARSEEGIVMAGGRPPRSGHLKGVPDTYETGRGGGQGGRDVLASDNAMFASAVSSSQASESHPQKGLLSQGESQGARLTVSPSMKIPTESPIPPSGGGYPVPSSSSRSGSFGAGQSESYRG